MSSRTPSVDDVVAGALASAPWTDGLELMTTLSRLDRYQASAGIEDAAEVLSVAALRLGLPAPELRTWPADGRAQWWTFDAPVPWTVERATVRVADHRSVVEVDHGRHPFALATYSAPVELIDRPLRLVDHRAADDPTLDLRGVVTILGPELWADATALARVERAGSGVVLVPSTTARGARARIELPPSSRSTVIGLTAEEMTEAVAIAGHGGRADVRVDIGRAATMPVLELALPGDPGRRELWVTAHLCHGRPGANDNLSGVAATLMTAAVLRRRFGELGPTVRFIWGPEYLATASALATATELPAALVNLDMVGEDQTVCRSPFVRERVSPTTPSDLEWHSDHATARAFAATGGEAGTWRADPFLGFSDHALCADPAVGVPAVAFCHPDDPFNHSADDTLDKVSRTEMLRSVAAASATVALQAGAIGGPEELAAARHEWSRRLVADADLVADALADTHPSWAEAHRAWARGRTAVEEAPRLEDDGPVLRRRWSGPVNLRALMGDVPADLSAVNRQRIMDDKRWMSVLFNAAIRVDGRRSTTQVLDEVSMNAGRPLDVDDRDLVVQVLRSSGWVDVA